MPNRISAVLLRPDTATLKVPTVHDATPHTWAWLTGAAAGVPTWTWALLVGLALTATLVATPLLRRQARKAGARTTSKPLTAEDRRDRKLLIGALIPAGIFWTAVLIGSGRGLIAFGRDDLNWTGGWELLVPLTLDGVAISFGLLAFRAIRKARNPDRATWIAWGAMLASSSINFGHEVGGSQLGAAYLATLSLLGMLIFHEFLAQFEEGAARVQRDNPKFGLRWFTWPTNTVCAWFAWRNHPVDVPEGTRVTVRLAVQHLEHVRADKAADRAKSADRPAWWVRVNPVLRSAQLATALAEQRSALVAEQTLRTRTEGELQRKLAARDETTEQMAERFRAQLEQLRSETAEQLQTERSERDTALTEQRSGYEAELARLRAELNRKVVPITRSGGTTSGKGPERRTAAPRSSDTDALHAMFTEHPEPGYEWTDREVNRITGAGFSSRAPRLTGMALRHLTECPERSHKTCYAERSGSGSDDTKEQAS